VVSSGMRRSQFEQMRPDGYLLQSGPDLGFHTLI
jgi:hypothetical protein